MFKFSNEILMKNIEVLSNLKGISLKELVDRIDMSYLHFNDNLNNKTMAFKIENLIKLSKELNMGIGDLISIDLAEAYKDSSIPVVDVDKIYPEYENYKENLRQNFYNIRKYCLGMTLVEAGNLCEMSYQGFKNIERGKYTPSIKAICKLASVANISIDTFFMKLEEQDLKNILVDRLVDIETLSLMDMYKINKLMKKMKGEE